MSNPKMRYFEQEDILHLTISDEPEANSVSRWKSFCPIAIAK
jgi:hypothetical protein